MNRCQRDAFQLTAGNGLPNFHSLEAMCYRHCTACRYTTGNKCAVIQSTSQYVSSIPAVCIGAHLPSGGRHYADNFEVVEPYVLDPETEIRYETGKSDKNGDY